MEEDLKPPDPDEDEAPEVFSVRFETGKHRFSRRKFVEAASITVAAAVISGCSPAATPAGKAPAGVVGANAVTATPQPTDTSAPTQTSTPSPTATETPTSTPTFTATPVSITVTVRNQGARVRTGPGTNYPIMGSLAVNVVLVVVGRLVDKSWLKVRIKTADLPKMTDKSLEAVEGWIRSDQVDLKGQSLDTLPVDAAPPTPTPLPNEPIAPGTDGIQYKYTDPYGNEQTLTMPCGSPIPDGAVCVCNCVAACSCDTYVAPAEPPAGESGGTTCTCDTVHYWYPN